MTAQRVARSQSLSTSHVFKTRSSSENSESKGKEVVRERERERERMCVCGYEYQWEGYLEVYVLNRVMISPRREGMRLG
jgi:hypothetical protein